MVTPSVIILPFALRLLLANKLQKSILLLCGRRGQAKKPPSISESSIPIIDLSVGDIPLKLVKNSGQIQYRSAIAFKVAKIFNTSAQPLSQVIEAELTNLIEEPSPSDCPPPLERVWKQCTVSTEAGWIQIELSETGVALWLQLLIEQLPTTQLFQHNNQFQRNKNYEDDNKSLGNTTIFKVQYTHARCCSLLRLASQEHLIVTQPLELGQGQSIPVITAPHPIPWVISTHRLKLQHSIEAQLVLQLVTALDGLAALTLLKIHASHTDPFIGAIELSNAFQKFHAACRLYGEHIGETQTTTLELVQTRLGLVSATQVVLNALLQEGIGVPALTVL